MENFNWTSFTKKIAINATVSDLYAAWTVPQEIERWFLSTAIYKTSEGKLVDRKKSIQQGDRYEWSWFLFDIIEHGKIIEANSVDTLKFTFAGECNVEVKLSQKNNQTIVELTQDNIPTDDQSKRGIRIGCDAGWSFFLVNLKSIYEGGIDLRNKDVQLTGMLNN